MTMREPTDREYKTAKRAVAKFARKIRETTDNPYIKGSLINAYADDGTASFELTCAPYDVAEVEAAVVALGFKALPRQFGVTVDDLPVNYPKDK